MHDNNHIYKFKTEITIKNIFIIQKYEILQTFIIKCARV